MRTKHVLMAGAFVGAVYLTYKQVMKRKHAAKLVGYIPKRISNKVRKVIENGAVQVNWKVVGMNQNLLGLRIRIFQEYQTDMTFEPLPTVNDCGFMIAGVSFEDRQEIIRKMKEGDKMYLVHNPHEKDENCVEVWIGK